MVLMNLFLLLVLYGALGSTPVNMDTTGDAQIYLTQATHPRHAVALEQFDAFKIEMNCLVGAPPVSEGVSVTVNSRIYNSDNVVAGITVTGACPAGTELLVPTTSVTCSYSAGWVDGPVCLPVTCDNSVLADVTLTNCTGATTAYGEVCATECAAGTPSGTATAKCGQNGWVTDFCCGGSLTTCGTFNSYNLGVPGSSDNKYDGASNDLEALWGSDIKYVAKSYRGFCSISADSQIQCIGSNSQEQIVGQTSNPVSVIASYSGLLNAPIDYFKGGHYFFGLLTEGKAYLWGQNSYGQLMRSDKTSSNIPTLSEVTNVVKMDIQSFATVLQKSDGSWVGGGYGEQGVFEGISVIAVLLHPLPANLPGGKVPMSYSVTHNFGFGVTEDNFVYGISSSAGHPAVCLSSVVSSFTLVNDAAGMQGTVDEVACAYNQCVFRTNTGKLFVCASSTSTFGGSSINSGIPVDITAALKVDCPAGRLNFSSDHYGFAFWGQCPNVYSFSIGGNGATCESAAAGSTLVKVNSLPRSDYKSVYVGDTFTVALQ